MGRDEPVVKRILSFREMHLLAGFGYRWILLVCLFFICNGDKMITILSVFVSELFREAEIIDLQA